MFSFGGIFLPTSPQGNDGFTFGKGGYAEDMFGGKGAAAYGMDPSMMMMGAPPGMFPGAAYGMLGESFDVAGEGSGEEEAEKSKKAKKEKKDKKEKKKKKVKREIEEDDL